MPGDGLDLAIGAASFQEVDGCVLTKPVERVVLVDAAQTKTATLWLQLIPEEYSRLLWFRAEGWPRRKLARYFGCSRRQVKLRWRDGVVGLWESL